jgi:hypothetical protein
LAKMPPMSSTAIAKMKLPIATRLSMSVDIAPPPF